MSENEKYITPREKELLKSLNNKAALLLEFEEICKEQKMPFNPAYMDTLNEQDLRELIYNFSPEGQAELKKRIKYETKFKK
jgi:hypothetical protein